MLLVSSPNDPIGQSPYCDITEYKYPVHSHNIHSFAAVNYQLPRGEPLFHFSPINILEIFKDFFACRIVLAANRHNPKIFKDFSNQQQQSTAASSSSNQQQQSTAAINSNNQHQRPSTAISIHPTRSTSTIHDDFR